VYDALNPPDEEEQEQEEGDDVRDDLSSVHSPRMPLDTENEEQAQRHSSDAQGGSAGENGGNRPDSPSYWESPVGKSRGQDVPANPPPLDFRPLQWSAQSTSTTKPGKHESQPYLAGSALQVARNKKA
jgi:hypothetical protein